MCTGVTVAATLVLTYESVPRWTPPEGDLSRRAGSSRLKGDPHQGVPFTPQRWLERELDLSQGYLSCYAAAIAFLEVSSSSEPLAFAAFRARTGQPNPRPLAPTVDITFPLSARKRSPGTSFPTPEPHCTQARDLLACAGVVGEQAPKPNQ